jgi:hypothetical protein
MRYPAISSLDGVRAADTNVCQGYVPNGLCVGYYQYLTYNNLSSHRRSANSSYLNGPAVVERPHLLGPGTYNDNNSMFLPYQTSSMNTLTVGPSGTGTSGSSFASPMVLAAQIQALQYGGFTGAISEQLANKAAILASTVDANADGAIGKTTTWSGQPSDAEDGAGQINFINLKQIIDYSQIRWLNTLSDSSFVSCGTGCREYAVASVGAYTLGTSLRIAMAYNQCTTSRSTSPFLNNDLDLVYQAAYPCRGSASSVDTLSEVEMLETSNLACGGVIKIRIKNGATLHSCGTSPYEPVGVAWSSR